MDRQTNTAAPTMEQIDQEVQQLFQDIFEVLKKKPRRTTVAVEALLKLLQATAVQLPPSGIADVSFLLGHVAGDLLQFSCAPKTTH